MQKVKIISVTEPVHVQPYNFDSNYNTYEIVVDYGDGKPYKMYLNRLDYKVFVLEQKLLEQGVNAELLKEYYDAVSVMVEFNTNQD